MMRFVFSIHSMHWICNELASSSLIDHLDRSADKLLLRGRRGRIRGWELHEHEASRAHSDGDHRVLSHVPRVVYVDFKDEAWESRDEDRKWKFPGLPAGVYPIYATERTWHLDGYRKGKARLAIQRQQIPLAPSFAITAHAAQGQTLNAVIAD